MGELIRHAKNPGHYPKGNKHGDPLKGFKEKNDIIRFAFLFFFFFKITLDWIGLDWIRLDWIRLIGLTRSRPKAERPVVRP